MKERFYSVNLDLMMAVGYTKKRLGVSYSHVGRLF